MHAKISITMFYKFILYTNYFIYDEIFNATISGIVYYVEYTYIHKQRRQVRQMTIPDRFGIQFSFP